MTEVLYSENAIHHLPDIVHENGWKKVLLVTGKKSFEVSGADLILPALENVADVLQWSDFAPNTDSADVVKGLAVLRNFAPDAVIAVGGGSVMDMAKLLCAYTDQQDVVAAIRSNAEISGRKQALVLVPTTAGSGSEATHFAVVYIGHEKFSVAAPALYADHIILDPGLVRSGSKHQRAVSGIDAVCQSIESLWAVSGTEQSRRFARHALSILLKHIGRFVKRADTQSAHGMMIGSYLAGRAIDVSRTTAAHALSYAITKQYGISHGHAVALTLGAFIEGHAGIEAIQPILKAFRVNTAPEAAAKFREIVRSIGLPSSFTDAGITTPLQLQQIVASVNLERLSNNPVKFSLDEMTAMLERAA